jgi:diacylglycerol kinase (ATP)
VPDKIVVIANPAARRGKARTQLREIHAAFAAIGVTQFHETRASGDEQTLASAAISRGAETIVVAGGDGTCTRVAAEILERGTSCSIAVIPCGTGNDFAKTLGVRNLKPVDIAALVRANQQRQIDVGRADNRHFINTCGFGFDPAVLEEAKRVRFLRGESVYVYAAVQQLFTYKPTGIEIEGAEGLSGEALMTIISNGSHLGGAFHVAPSASVVDGRLDITVFGNARPVGRGLMFARAMRGTRLSLKTVKTAQMADVALRFAEIPMMEIDGELTKARSSTVHVECLPRALHVIAAPGFPR